MSTNKQAARSEEMGTDIKRLNVHRTDALPDYQHQLTDIEKAKQQLAEQNAEANRRMAELVEQETELVQAKQDARRVEKRELLELSNYYRDLATQAVDRTQADEFVRWAMDAERQARAITIDGEADSEPVMTSASTGTAPWWERQRALMGLLMMGMTGLLIFLAGEYFHMFRQYILEQNAALPLEQQMQPYDFTSMQKFAYEKMVQFTDLPVALVLLLLVMPPVAFYVLPFVRTKPNFATEFRTELTPFQRCTLSTVFLLGFLLLAVLAHLVRA